MTLGLLVQRLPIMDGQTWCLVRANACTSSPSQASSCGGHTGTQRIDAHGMEYMQTQCVCCLNEISGAAAGQTTRDRIQVCTRTCSIWESRRNHGNARKIQLFCAWWAPACDCGASMGNRNSNSPQGIQPRSGSGRWGRIIVPCPERYGPML